jgi:hypothetical protein
MALRADDDAVRAPRAGAPRFDARLRTSLRTVLLMGAVFAFFGFAFAGLGAGLSVALGGVLAAGNLWVLARIVTELLPTDSAGAEAQSRGGWALVAVLKILGLLTFAWLLMRHAIVSPVPMLVGFGSLPIGIAIGSLVSDRSAPGESSTQTPPSS